MGATKLTILVKLPDGSPVSGARIEGLNRDTYYESAKQWYGTTNGDERYSWDHISTGVWGDKYDFYCRYVDNSGTEWKGELSDRILTSKDPVVKEMTLRKLFLDEDLEFKLPTDVEENIGKSEFGTNQKLRNLGLYTLHWYMFPADSIPGSPH
jgi:hypothetical protein